MTFQQQQQLLDILPPYNTRYNVSTFLDEHKETMSDGAYKELMEAATLLKPVRLFKVTF